MDEWRKRFAMLPDKVVEKTLENSTCYYLNIESENRQDPRRHYKYQFPGICLPRQRETVASDTFFPSATSRWGNTCSQFFVGLDSDQWKVYPMRSESHNVSALQDYCRNVGIPSTLKIDNAQSEETTEPHSPWQNPAEPKIGQLNSMVKNVMRQLNVPLNEHDWAQKWCTELHNCTASRKLGWKLPNGISKGYTQ
eukprot:10713595-Ditylum_brightwellii.AAC.1